MSLHIELHGNPEAQPLVLLHGWGMTSAIWQSWLPQLENDYRLLLIDLPGLGSSPFDGDQYSVQAVVDQIAVQTESLFDQPAIWLGWSLGGVIAAQLAASYPQQAKALITIATNPCFVQREDWEQAMDTATFEGFQQALEQHPAKTLNRFAMLQVQGDPQAKALLRQLKQLLADTDSPSHLAESLALLADDYRPLFAGLEIPRLHLFGSADALVPVAVSQQPLLQAHSQVIEGSAHLPFISAEQATSQRVRRWLNEVVGD
jgi:pimeloyl-[acyl-carrier protein] methyl ester esterase